MAPLPRRGNDSWRGRGRGRGRGRWGLRESQTSRLKEVADEEEHEQADHDEIVHADPFEQETQGAPYEDVPSSEEEDYVRGGAASYSALLRTFQKSTPQEHGRKRRKLGHVSDSLSKGGDQYVNSKSKDQYQSETLEHEEDVVLDGEQVELAATVGSNETVVDEDEESDTSDPFESHFDHPDEVLLSQSVKAITTSSWTTEYIPSKAIGKISFTQPKTGSAHSSHIRHNLATPKNLKLKNRLLEPAMLACAKFDPTQSALAPGIFNYSDLLFGGRTVENADGLRKMACLHALNHVFKTRDRIIKNTARLARDSAAADLDLRDQGFTRPKILILLETRQACARYLNTITGLCDPDQQENKKRFQDAFVAPEDKFSDDKPADFRELFEGNDDNEFRLGVKFTRKTMKYYSQFYNSDIILASPLGLRRAIKSDDPKKADYDFLSSIEIVIMDQTDAMLMQNWDHVLFALSHLNLQPKEPHDCDFSRVRQWYLDQNSKHLRQTIVFSAYVTPELNALFSNTMHNVAGKVKATPTYTGAMLDLQTQGGGQLKQTFTRFPCADPMNDPDARFKHFTTAILAPLARHQPSASTALGALVFVPSYLDFVRIRNHFSTAAETAHLSFGCISEYTPQPEVRRARSHFMTGRHDVLLYTGRAHHFRRYMMKGVKRVVFYGLPENPLFYGEIAGGYLGKSVEEGMVDARDASIRVMFSKWDVLALGRVVGTERVGRMIREGTGDTFEFR